MDAVCWQERAFDPSIRQALERRGLSPILARLLAARGLTVQNVDAFFDPALSRLAEATSLPGVAAAADVILPFIVGRRKIVVFGDYDADGVCASAILVRTLRILGGVADAFIPERFTEGYGMTESSIARMLSEHPDVALVITVDNGITAASEVAALKARGLTVVVTDHHLPGNEIPTVDALVNPHIASASGCDGLCGAGVAFFLAAALAKGAAAQGLYAGGKFSGPLLVLAGIATVADLMPLTDQNRILVTQALAAFRLCAPVGLRELFDRTARRVTPVAVRDFGFALAPRINAAGRMDTARTAYDLLMTTDREEARRLALRVDELNVKRKNAEQTMQEAVEAQVASYDGLPAVVARGVDWHPGVAGIVAARIMELAHVPVAIVVGDHGSVRAPDGYNVHDALAAAAPVLLRFGGHAAAGGFTIRPGKYEAFADLFAAACAAQRAAVPSAATITFDGWLEPSDLTLALYEDIQRMEPFGEGNPEPRFGLRNVMFSDVRPIGIDGRHLTFAFVDRAIPRAVWWNHGSDVETLRKHDAARFDVMFAVQSSDYGGFGPSLELRLSAVRPSA